MGRETFFAPGRSSHRIPDREIHIDRAKSCFEDHATKSALTPNFGQKCSDPEFEVVTGHCTADVVLATHV
jgi:hypothetical protein